MPDAIGAIVFDAYGTLFDVHSVAARCETLFPGQGRQLSALWRSKQLEYTWLRSLMQRYEDFAVVTAAALRHACTALHLSLSEDAAKALMEEYLHLAAYPDALTTLPQLQGQPLAILSNGTPAMLDAVIRHNGLAPLLQRVLSVATLRIYKPHPNVYRLAVDELREPPERIVFVSSNFWDVAGATSFGLKTFWINRAGVPADELSASPAGILNSLSELTGMLEQL